MPVRRQQQQQMTQEQAQAIIQQQYLAQALQAIGAAQPKPGLTTPITKYYNPVGVYGYILGDKEDLDWYPNNSNSYKRKYTGGQ